MTDWRTIDRQHYWHAFTQMAEYEPLVVREAEGVWLIDDQGRRLLDGVSSMWCNVHGHRHPAMDAAIREQLNQVAHVTSLGMSNPTTIRLTEKLIEIMPDGESPRRLECVFYSSDGASAVEVALKMAFQYWRQIEHPEPQRDLYLTVGGAYHGDTLGAVSVGGVARFHAMFAPLLFEVVQGPSPDSYRTSAGVSEEGLANYYLAEYRRLFEQHGHRLAAVIVEPLVQCAAGLIVHPPGFLRGLRELAKEFGTLMIADEIATGMGRTGKMWACEWEDVQPDFLCTGKGLSGGYLPIAATITTRDVWNAFLGSYDQSRSFFHGHTYGGNPLAAAVALASIELFEREKTLSNVLDQADYLSARLEEIGTHPLVGDVRQRGLVAAIELVQNKKDRIAFPWQDRVGAKICQRALERGVWLRPLGNVIVLMPPLCIQRSEMEFLIDVVKWAIG